MGKKDVKFYCGKYDLEEDIGLFMEDELDEQKTFYLDKKTAEKLEKIVDRKNIPLSEFVRQLIFEKIEEIES